MADGSLQSAVSSTRATPARPSQLSRSVQNPLPSNASSASLFAPTQRSQLIISLAASAQDLISPSELQTGRLVQRELANPGGFSGTNSSWREIAQASAGGTTTAHPRSERWELRDT